MQVSTAPAPKPTAKMSRNKKKKLRKKQKRQIELLEKRVLELEELERGLEDDDDDDEELECLKGPPCVPLQQAALQDIACELTADCCVEEWVQDNILEVNCNGSTQTEEWQEDERLAERKEEEEEEDDDHCNANDCLQEQLFFNAAYQASSGTVPDNPDQQAPGTDGNGPLVSDVVESSRFRTVGQQTDGEGSEARRGTEESLRDAKLAAGSLLVNPLEPLNADTIEVKIADLGNACWVHKHFTDDIQTRQYRSLEVLLGSGYSTPADIWSTACMAFELATGDYLFEPHSGDEYSRDEDHIALIIELLGKIPRKLVTAGKYSKEFFTKKGDLRHISKLRPWALLEVLVEKYEWQREEAQMFTDFLLPMLDLIPEKRATAAECLRQAWIAS
ncbi:hypothetical protein AAFF_G00033860 [Aldrovandia affinis]|uniref:non-specific serine/threonine protein kinase n=1 Tax=Aldrovandia affinis TaxID=143900 RepID=A0AAD7S3P0_9TELE|nr:hypothetical protein AAFF_G00033860 [Aldrovandia affinis]